MKYNARTKPATGNDAIRLMHKTICKLAHKAVKNNRQDFDDCYQYGAMGVARAYNDYNEENAKAAFTTLAYKYAYQHIMDHYQRKQYDYLNSRDFKSAEDHMSHMTVYDDTEDRLEFEQLLSQMDTTDKIIVLMRNQGYTFQEIADALNKVPGNNYTLHQVRNRQQKVFEAM